MALSNFTSSCPAPFLPESSYPSTGGYTYGRFCGPFTESLYCCLPCPLEQWVYPDSFTHDAKVAYWFNVPALIAQVFLLVTYAVVERRGKERGDGGGVRYLSVGLCLALMMLELSFIVPLGTKPDQCFNDITPRDMYSSPSCAWSGALLEAGSMCGCVWILLRSIWTHLRVCWDIKHTPTYMWCAQAVGWGLPALFLAVSLPVTGVSYRGGGTCIPNPHRAFVTWVGWLIAFGCLAAMIQFVTTGFCLVVYARSLLGHHNTPVSTETGTSADPSSSPSKAQSSPSNKLGKRLAWRRVREVMMIQWRNIVLSIMVIVEALYFSTVYVAQQRAAEEDAKPEHTIQIEAWALCLITSGGDKNQCLDKAHALGIPETTVIASLFMASLIGIFTFCLMVRWSMLIGWWELIRSPRRTRPKSDDFVMMCRGGSKKALGDGEVWPEQIPEKKVEAKGVLPDLNENQRQMSIIPEAGNVTKRHETTNLFEDSDDEEDEKRSRPVGGDDLA